MDNSKFNRFESKLVLPFLYNKSAVLKLRKDDYENVIKYNQSDKEDFYPFVSHFIDTENKEEPPFIYNHTQFQNTFCLINSKVIIKHCRTYFYKAGVAFFVITLEMNDISEKEVLELHNNLVSIRLKKSAFSVYSKIKIDEPIDNNIKIGNYNSYKLLYSFEDLKIFYLPKERALRIKGIQLEDTDGLIADIEKNIPDELYDYKNKIIELINDKIKIRARYFNSMRKFIEEHISNLCESDEELIKREYNPEVWKYATNPFNRSNLFLYSITSIKDDFKCYNSFIESFCYNQRAIERSVNKISSGISQVDLSSIIHFYGNKNVFIVIAKDTCKEKEETFMSNDFWKKYEKNYFIITLLVLFQRYKLLDLILKGTSRKTKSIKYEIVEFHSLYNFTQITNHSRRSLFYSHIRKIFDIPELIEELDIVVDHIDSIINKKKETRYNGFQLALGGIATIIAISQASSIITFIKNSF